MAFDFSNAQTTTTGPTLASVSRLVVDPKIRIAAKRAAVLALYDTASRDPGADWQSVATLFALVTPRPKAEASPAKAADASAPAADAGEWASYTAAQARGRGALFEPGSRAVIRYDNGDVFAWQLPKRANLDSPDWCRAIRGAAVANARADMWTAYDPRRGVYADAAKVRETAEAALIDATGAADLIDWIAPPAPDLDRAARRKRLDRIGAIARAFARPAVIEPRESVTVW